MSEPTRSGDADAATAAKQGALMVSAPRFAKGETMSKFVWGKVIERFVYDFDGKSVEVVKYYPDKFVDGFHVKGEYEENPAFHIDELHMSASTLDEIIITWIATKRLGLNQHALVSGICRALCIH